MSRVHTCAVTLLLLVAAGANAQVPAAPATGITFVPWKVLNPGDAPLKGDLVLYWVPATREEIRRSPMLTSRPLAIYASQCVGMQLVRPEDDGTIERLEIAQLPAAVIVDGDGKVVGRVTLVDNALRVLDVEHLVRDALTKRDIEAEHLLDDARTKMDAGERDEAIDLYRRVAAQRCLFPRKARDAERALHKLGVEVAGRR
jgi:hypothetical protein